MKVCFYAINGHGLGHLSRSYAIAKKLCLLLESVKEEADIQFLTTSEADYLVREFPVFKLPSRSCFKGNKAAGARYFSNGKMFVSSMLSHFSPHLLVMDTIPTGSFNEFTFIKSFAQWSCLIERHKNETYASSEVHQSHLPLFDRIIIPDSPDARTDYVLDPSLDSKLHFVGKIQGFDKRQALSKEAVRAYFGAKAKPLIYVSAGGGGDPQAQEQINSILKALDEIDCKIVIGYGPLSRQEKTYNNDKCIAFTDVGISRYFQGFDLAISAAGYNTYEELLSAKVPTLFFHQTKGLDQQERRVADGLKKAWHYHLDLEKCLITQIKTALSKPKPEGLQTRKPSKGATQSARLMAELYFHKNEKKLQELQLADILLDWHEDQHWQSHFPAEVICFFQTLLSMGAAADRVSVPIKILCAAQNKTVEPEIIHFMQLCEEMRNYMDQEQMTKGNQKRFLLQLQKQAPKQSGIHGMMEAFKTSDQNLRSATQ